MDQLNGDSALHRAIIAFKRDYIRQTLEAHDGNRARAAKELGTARSYLFRLIRELHIDVPAGCAACERTKVGRCVTHREAVTA